MNRPEYVKVQNVLYKINTDFRVAIECNNIANNAEIGDYERGLAIVYTLFGESGLNCPQIDELIEKAVKYIRIYSDSTNAENNDSEKSFELDFKKCEGLIRSSFKFDYNYDPYELDYLHWYDFYNDLENLSTSDLGTCCKLNTVVSILNQDVSKIKDEKQKIKLLKVQQELKQKYCVSKEKKMTKEQEESANTFFKKLGLL